jgi:dipeptidyl aminopeptidase/acylaminoacyl peptidase
MRLHLQSWITVTFLFLSLQLLAQKTPLDHLVYEKWRLIEVARISSDGKKLAWTESPGKGDNLLIIYQSDKKRFDTIMCGNSPVFSPDAGFLSFKIDLSHDSIRSLQMKKKKPEKFYTLGIFTFTDDSIKLFEKVIKHTLPADEGNSIAIHFEKEKVKEDKKKVSDTLPKAAEKPETPLTDAVNAPKTPKDKKEAKGSKLLVYTPSSGAKMEFTKVNDFCFAASGNWGGILQIMGDSIDSIAVVIFNTAKNEQRLLGEYSGYARKVCMDGNGNQLSFLYSTDTSSKKSYSIYYYDFKNKLEKQYFAPCFSKEKPMSVSEDASFYFSNKGSRLIFGVGRSPEQETKDSIPEEEKVKLDLWNYRDERLQTQQLKQLENDRKKSYTAILNTRTQAMSLLGSDTLNYIDLAEFGDAMYFKGISHFPYRRQNTRLGTGFYDLYRVSENGDRIPIASGLESASYILPDGKNAIWYNPSDSSWYQKTLPGGKPQNISRSLGLAFYDEEHDVPSPPSSYGFIGWSPDYRYVYINDRYDIWQFDLSGKLPPTNICKGYGRKNNIRFDYQKTDSKETAIDITKPILLRAFSETDKHSGYYRLDKGKEPIQLIMEPERISGLIKASKSDAIILRRSTFTMYPDIWLSDITMKSSARISNAGSQLDPYLWGSVETIQWTSYQGKKLNGLVFKPALFNSNDSYPMIVYFYERNSDELYYFNHPTASRSVISPSFYTSNGYVVFIPDITYGVGNPGEDAFDAIMSGVDAVCKNTWVDSTRMALQGQSWGGYQAAYLVTRTKRFKAAMAGAPVSNMTSAYGGIRWGSGVNRAFQYERGQSRIGANLWDSLPLYLNNSPLFFANNINTPLLIMSNDNDGAVPWYQGIELFSALYRLDKPVWMLTYNGDDHNLLKWPNRVDLSIRMFSFFEHYLKGKPAPQWMTEGIPALEKGKTMAY